MQKWEYMYIVAYKNDVKKLNGKDHNLGANSLPGFLNDSGDKGWELVNTFMECASNEAGKLYWSFVFKRPKE